MIGTRAQVWLALLLLGGAALLFAPPAPDDVVAPARGVADAALPSAAASDVRDTARTPARTPAGPDRRAAAPVPLPALPPVARLQPRAAAGAGDAPGSGPVQEAARVAARLWQSGAPPAAAAVAPPPRPATAAVPVAAAAPAPPPAPAAPAPPYRLVGRYSEDGRDGVILQGPDNQVLVVHAGDKLGADYRVDSLTGNLLMLTYLPLNLPQTLDIGLRR